MAGVRAREAYILLLVPVLIAAYLVSFNGRYRADDEHILAARAQSLALRGEIEAPQVYGNERVRLQMAWGEPANQIEPAFSWLGAGFYRLGAVFGWGGRQAQFTLNIYTTVAAAALVYLTVVTLGLPPPTALITALAFGLASPAFPYALTFYRDPLAMAFVALALWGAALMIRGHPQRTHMGLALFIVGFVGGALSKNSSLALLPALGVGLAAGGWRGEGSGSTKKLWLALGVIAAAGVAAVFALEPEGPLARFSAPYYAFLAQHFLASPKGPMLAAVFGPWISPAKSTLLFAPPLVLLLWPRWLRRIPITFTATVLAFTLFLSAAQGLFYGQDWSGGFGWGLRFLLPVLPGLLVLTAPVIDRARRSAPGRRLLGGLIGVGTLFQLAAGWVPWRHAFEAWQRAGLEPYAAGAVWDPMLLQIPLQLSYLTRPELWDTAWLRLLQAGRYRALIAPLLALALLGAALLALRNLRRARMGDRGELRRTLALTGIALVLPLAPMLALLEGDPALVDNRRNFGDAVRWLQPQLETGDLVAVDSYATPLWTYLTNRWASPHAWYSLPYEIPGTAGTSADPHPATVQLFEREHDEGARIWYLTTPESPDFGLRRELGWLDQHRQLESALVFPGRVRLYVYVYR